MFPVMSSRVFLEHSSPASHSQHPKRMSLRQIQKQKEQVATMQAKQGLQQREQSFSRQLWGERWDGRLQQHFAVGALEMSSRSTLLGKGPAGKTSPSLRRLPLGKRSFRVPATVQHKSTAARALLQEDVVLHTGFSGDYGEEGSPGWTFNEDGVMPFQTTPTARVMAPPNARPLLILPGFGNNTEDYEAPFGRAEGSLAHNLRSRGFKVATLQLERKDWFKVARGLLTLGWWSGRLTTHPGYTWYLERIAAALACLQEETGADKVDLVGHSAGGWLGRAFLGDPKYMPAGVTSCVDDAGMTRVPHPAIASLVTLGTPQKPPPAELTRDMTGGAQAWVHTTYPGAYFAPHGVNYLCVAGVSVRGYRERGADGKPVKMGNRPRKPHEYAHDSYAVVCGDGQGLEGDAVVPLCSAFLAGARHVLLPGVWHSVSRIGTFEEAAEVPWYGSEVVVDQWLGPFIEHAYGYKGPDGVASQDGLEVATQSGFAAQDAAAAPVVN